MSTFRLSLYTITGLALVLILILGLSTALTSALHQETILLEAHGELMHSGEVTASSPIILGQIRANLGRFNWLILAGITASSLILYFCFAQLARRSFTVEHPIRSGDAVLSSTSGEPANLVERRLDGSSGSFPGEILRLYENNQLVQFSSVSFVIMLILGVGLSLLISIRLDDAILMLKAHGHAMADGQTQITGPYSIQEIVGLVRQLRWASSVAIAVAFVIQYGSLVSIVWRGVSERKQLERRLREALSQMESLAMTDSLTGLLNRRAVLDRAEAELGRALREGSALSLILLDIDHFKTVNDEHGHEVGDQALQLLAKTLVESKRSYDWVGRWGGDEFLMVLPGTTGAEAGQVAERVRSRLAALRIPLPDGADPRLSVSQGISAIRGGAEPARDLDALLREADEALYHAKREGRDRTSQIVNGRPRLMTNPAAAG